MFTRLRRFPGETSGNIVVIFGLSLIPLLGVVGLAVDYTRASQIHTSLDDIADSAALAGLSAQSVNPNATPAQQMAAAETFAKQIFDQQVAQRGFSTTSSSATADNVSGQFTLTVAYGADAPSSFGNLFGIAAYSVGGKAVAVNGTPKYIDIYVLVDSSTSMGVGATQADITIMNNTAGMDGGSGGCMIACHSPEAAKDGVALAHAAGAQLRFDVVRTALQQIVSQAQTTAALTKATIRFGVYTFATNFQTEIDLNANLPQVGAAVANMQLAGFHAGTNTYKALNTLRGKIGAVGDGSSPSSPLSFVILATDGTGNASDNAPGKNWFPSPDFYPAFSTVAAGMPFPHAVPDPGGNYQMDIEGVDPAWCQQFKDMNVSMMTLETPYTIPAGSTEPRIAYIRDTLLPVIPGQLQACASKPGFHYSATAPADIQSAMTSLFKSAVTRSARLSQ